MVIEKRPQNIAGAHFYLFHDKLFNWNQDILLITELEIDNNDRIIKTNHYDDKF